MSATLPILDSIRKRIEDKTEQFSIELFPDDLEHYNLTDEFGAVLVQMCIRDRLNRHLGVGVGRRYLLDA